MTVRSWLIVGILVLTGMPLAMAEIVGSGSAITQVTVYPDAARVTRTVKVDLKEGTQTVVLKGVQPNFDENSLSVSGAGTATVKILGAGIKSTFLAEPVDERVRQLEAKIQVVDDAVAALQNDMAVLDQKKAFLDSVRLFTGTQLPKDMASKVPTVDELKGTLTFLEEGTKAYGDGRQMNTIKLREKALERETLQNELNQVRSNNGRWERLLSVDVECLKPGDLTIELSYTVNDVGWYPVYDARVAFEKAKANLSALAVIHQTTGEDWSDVALTLSTARPSVGGRMPELSSVWYLMPQAAQLQYEPYYAKSKRAMNMALGGMSDSAMKEERMESAAPAAAPAPARAAVSYAQAENAGAALVYKVARPVTVKSDGSEVRVPLLAQDLDVVFEYAATPKLSTYAYLKSQVMNDPKDQIMAGRVNIFLDGAFVGNSDIQKTIAPGEKFDLYLGVDEGVAVKRELMEKKSDDTMLGNIPSPTKKLSYVYKITVQSYKPRAVLLKLFDQLPVAQDDKIKVARIQLSLKPDTDKYEGREGVYMWTLPLNPGEKKEIMISYVVEFPRDMVVSGL
ncbi:MAG: mucoidy inhibitor MuiA family protein [Candidatus Omnitrophica bacterium]|nr:mucoidy inhibitor MuiA family protein [Candidatus Omnitrophota bacterium]